MNERTPGPPSERRLLLTLACVQFTHIVDFMIVMPLGPQLMRIFSIGPEQFAGIVSSYTFSAGVAGFIAASVIDRFDRKKALQSLYWGFVAGTLLCATAPTYEILLAARIITGAFGGVQVAIVLSIVGDVVPHERRATAMGILTAAFSVASVAGVPLGLFIATMWSWHAPFAVLVIISLGVAYLIRRFIPSVRGHLRDDRGPVSVVEPLRSIAADRNQQRALLLMMVMMIGHFCIIPFISPYMVSNVGFAEAELTYIYLIGGVFTIFTSPAVGRWADSRGKYPVFAVLAPVSIIPVLLITNMPPVPVALALVVTTFFFVASSGRFIPAIAMITSTVRPENRGGFMSINSAVQQVSAGIASVIGGMIVSEGANGRLLHFEKVGIVGSAGILLCVWIARKIRAVDAGMPSH